MPFYVKTLGGKTIVLDAESTDTIAKVKQMILESEKIEVSRQRIVSGGSLLEDHKTLDELKLDLETTVHLIETPASCALLQRERCGFGVSGASERCE